MKPCSMERSVEEWLRRFSLGDSDGAYCFQPRATLVRFRRDSRWSGCDNPRPYTVPPPRPTLQDTEARLARIRAEIRRYFGEEP